MTRKDRMIEKISNNVKFEELEVLNNSYLHKGHAGDDGTLETHYKVTIKSNYLSNLSKVNAHKEINKALQEEFDSGLHALEIKINS